VVIVGAGFGGLFAAKRLGSSPVALTVVDRTNHHLFQPLLYQVATGILSEGDIAPPIRDVLRRQANTEVLLGDVTSIELDARTVAVEALGERITLAYDSLIVAAGAGQSYFGHDEFASYAPGMKSIDDALELRGRIFGAFEMAEHDSERERRDAWLTFAVVGGGPTGVELAGQIAELSRRSLHRNYRHFDPGSARVILLEAADHLLDAFPDSLRRRAQRDLERRGVEVRLRTMVVGLDDEWVEVRRPDGEVERIHAHTKIWAAGVQASPIGASLAAQTGAQIDRAGRISVLPDCTLPGHPEVFVVGDMISLAGLPGVAEVAMQTGRYAAATIERRLGGDAEQRPFHYHDLGTMATISRFQAIVTIGPFRIAGFLGWVLWLVVHLAFLTGFKNRFAAVANWTIAFLGRGRPQRAITQQQVAARSHGLTRAG
jgi:NADH:quinone reductase (non-electrogenic)